MWRIYKFKYRYCVVYFFFKSKFLLILKPCKSRYFSCKTLKVIRKLAHHLAGWKSLGLTSNRTQQPDGKQPLKLQKALGTVLNIYRKFHQWFLNKLKRVYIRKIYKILHCQILLDGDTKVISIYYRWNKRITDLGTTKMESSEG